MRLLLICLFLLAGSTSGLAQEVKEQQFSAPTTKIEAFQAKTGIVLVRGYTKVGEMRALGGQVSVDAREFRDASKPDSRVTGVAISVKETGRLERENVSFIDSDEINSLIVGIDYISQVTKNVTKFENFEIEYRTKGDFKITVFNNSRGELSAAVSSGRIGRTSAYIELTNLSELRQYILKAKTLL